MRNVHLSDAAPTRRMSLVQDGAELSLGLTFCLRWVES